MDRAWPLVGRQLGSEPQVEGLAENAGVDDVERLRRANLRCQRVLSSTLAQSPDVLGAGQQFVARFDPDTGAATGIGFKPSSASSDAVAAAAAIARVFSLGREDIHYTKVIDSMRALASDPGYAEILNGLQKRWDMTPVDRITIYAYSADGTGLPKDGVTDGRIANRTLYAEIVHADDAAAILDHISDEQKLWALTGMVVDWICLAAQTQHLMHLIRPDVVPETTPWTGDQTSLFERWGRNWTDVGGGAAGAVT